MSIKLVQVPNVIPPPMVENLVENVFLPYEHLYTTYYNNTSVLGRAWYLDIAAGNMARYFDKALFWDHFWSKHCPAVRLDVITQAAKIAFNRQEGDVPWLVKRRHWHMFGIHSMDARWTKGGCWHTDVEGLAPYPSMMFGAKTQAYSCIIPLEVPEAGGNLKIVPVRHLGDFDSTPTEYECVKYRVGELLMFDSFFPHCIEEMTVDEEHPRRTVLVFHLLKVDGRIEYWY